MSRSPQCQNFWLPPRDSNPATVTAVQTFLVAPQGFEPRDGYRGTNIFGCPPGIRTPRRLPRYKHFWLPPRDSNPATVTAVQTFLVAPQGFEPRLSESESLVLPLNERA